ncbi:MAG: tetratricopeptide repeat protein [Candidatus Omnitrophica bacterium]|nr:tetratricopeptide repeat protein [Candidatus Omnitrophota bacterium]
MKEILPYIKGAVFLALLGVCLIFGPPRIAMLLNNKAVEQYNKGEMQAAIDFYTKSIKLYPTAAVYYNLACAYDAQGKIDQAIEHYKNALSHDSNHSQACRALVDIYRAQKDFNQAEMYLKKINALDNPSVKSDLIALKQEQLISLCNQAVREYEQGNTQQAIKKLQQAIALDSEFAPAHKMLGEIYLSLNDLGKASSSYKAAIKAGDNDPQLYSNIGVIYMRLENYSKAVEFMQKAYELAPKDIEIKYSFASVLRDNRQLERALGLYEQIAAEYPRYKNIHNDLAGVYQAMGSEKQAILEYEKARDIALKLQAGGDEQPWTRLSLAIAYNGLNNPEKAKNIIDKIIAENPEFSHAYYIRAQLFKKTGDIKAANADLLKARKLTRQIKPAAPTKSKRSEINTAKKTHPVSAFKMDTIIKLKNGQTIQGKLKKQTDNYVVLEMDMGSSRGEITFSKQKIKEIVSVN